MCTLAAKKINNNFFIFKNRDREYQVKTKVIKEKGKTKKLLIVDQRGHCEGLNEYGMGFIGATLQPYPRVRHKNLSEIARKILDQNNLKDIFEMIKNSKISANLIVADSKDAYIVEKTPSDFAITKIKSESVITNLSIKLDKRNGSKLQTVRDWAESRYLRGKKIIKNVKSFSDIITFLSDKDGYPNKSICSGAPWWIPTRCSYIYDLKNKAIYFNKSRPDKGSFKKYEL